MFAALRSALARPSPVLSTRGFVTSTVEGWSACKKYMALSDKVRDSFVPQPRGAIQTPKDFLTAIGRSTADVADKFKSWDHLFTATGDEMADSLAIPVRKRKYILQCREWFKRGVEPKAVELPKREKRHLKEREKVKLARLKKKGLA
ncbi:hypothetical protein BC830DRAFT_1146235 [Chytriomyces sp. MP71]|nr:hypothetical protein BC830DRAFT_1146235 [Chytriomyces sp. MP71]